MSLNKFLPFFLHYLQIYNSFLISGYRCNGGDIQIEYLGLTFPQRRCMKKEPETLPFQQSVVLIVSSFLDLIFSFLEFESYCRWLREKCLYSKHFRIWANQQWKDLHHDWNYRTCNDRYIWLHRWGKLKKKQTNKLDILIISGPWHSSVNFTCFLIF